MTPEHIEKSIDRLFEKIAFLLSKSTEVGRLPIRIGVGIHFGHLMLGTVGEERRMDGTVISDAVNLSARLEGLTKEYGAPVLVSEQVQTLIDGRLPFHTRYLGSVKVKGKKQSVGIFEVIEGETEDAARLKIVTTANFEEGVRAVQAQKFQHALDCIEKVLTVHPEDLAAKLLREQCIKTARQSSLRRVNLSTKRAKITRLPKPHERTK